jgi:antitoxin YefM
MLAVNYSTLRNNLKKYCDKATDEDETVIVTRKNEKNIASAEKDFEKRMKKDSKKKKEDKEDKEMTN